MHIQIETAQLQRALIQSVVPPHLKLQIMMI